MLYLFHGSRLHASVTSVESVVVKHIYVANASKLHIPECYHRSHVCCHNPFAQCRSFVTKYAIRSTDISLIILWGPIYWYMIKYYFCLLLCSHRGGMVNFGFGVCRDLLKWGWMRIGSHSCYGWSSQGITFCTDLCFVVPCVLFDGPVSFQWTSVSSVRYALVCKVRKTRKRRNMRSVNWKKQTFPRLATLT